jgi:hypothetical protein
VASCQKLEMIFESKVILQLSYQKLSITKNVLLNSNYSMKKKSERFWMIFEVENTVGKTVTKKKFWIFDFTGFCCPSELSRL